MTSTTMGPPPPRNPHPTTSTEAASTAEPESEPESKTSAVDEPQKISSTTTAAKPSMAPPPPTNPIPTPPETSTEQEKTKSKDPLVPYTIPEWSGPPCHKFSLEILKDGSIIDQFEVCEKGAYMFGRVELCDFILEHPTISRFHAVLQFKRNGDAYLYDLGSTHGTFVNKSQEWRERDRESMMAHGYALRNAGCICFCPNGLFLCNGWQLGMKGFFDQRKTGFRVYRNEAEAQEIFQQKTRVDL
ncbi:hypothetical protein NC653_011240 [Populus alba x Populus x berolinensis]|uniref:FHA domain-containing protein n=1 Tax=Populus alba x Populus x berolinensis TaxID=444605 RepID=A0AAD6W683_9ROSI|nr:hypothetical protein NC653_011240 [Populus alba x Populus x berolinensis]